MSKPAKTRGPSSNKVPRTIRSPKLPDGGTPMMTEERLQWLKTLVAVHEPELGELFKEIDRLRSALTQPPRQSIASDEIPYRGPFVFSAFGSGVAPARPAQGDARSGICCCYDGDTSRCPLHQTAQQAAELRSVDIADGNTVSLIEPPGSLGSNIHASELSRDVEAARVRASKWMYKLTARQLLFTRKSTLPADYADSVTTLLRQTVLNVQQQNDKLRAELKEGHEHYIEILAKYCEANERAEKAEAENAQHDRKVKQEALSEQQWIPLHTSTSAVELGMPPFDGEPVLIVTNHSWGNRVHRAKWTDEIHGKDIFGWAVDDCKHGPYALRGYTIVTHWRPLPAPPMEEGSRADALDPQAGGGAVPESGAPAKEI